MPRKPKTLVRPGLAGVPTRMQVTYLPDVSPARRVQPVRGHAKRTAQAQNRLGFGSLRGLQARAKDLAC